MNKNDLATCVTILEGIVASLELVIKIFKEKGTVMREEKK